MGRSTRQAKYVNNISWEQLKGVIGSEFENAVRAGVDNYLSQLATIVIQALMAGEVDSLCGQKYSRKSDGDAVRWGKQQGMVQVNGAKERLDRPRVRTKDGEHEIDLETYSSFSRGEVLSKKTLALIGSGVSTRQYQKTLQRDLRKHGVSRSSVSRRVIAESRHLLEAFLQRRWDKVKLVTIMFDGVRIGKTMVVAAVGIDCQGFKHVLGWKLGATENEIVCRDLIRQLVDAGLNVDRDYLFVVDGAKALIQAVRAAFGTHVAIQRCEQHKIRDVLDYLPPKHRKKFQSKLQTAYNRNTYKQASDELQQIRSLLLNVSEQAANSLTEGLEHTLTLHKLGITGGVRESLRTTNIIESTFARLRKNTHNVTAWADSDQVNRWLALGLTNAEAGYRRIPGYRQLPKLQRKLKEHSALQNLNH